MRHVNVNKVLGDAKLIVARLRTTNCTLMKLIAEYHCSHPTMMKAVLSQIPEDEWLRIRHRNLLRGNEKSRFQKGFTPWNKGKSYNPGGHSIRTRFKKGLLPHNAKPLGTITVRINKRDKRGPYRMIATPGPTPARHKWIPYAKYIWEQTHGPLPKRMLVVHLDGNSMNDSPENLKATDQAGNLALMRKISPTYKKNFSKAMKRTWAIRRENKVKIEAQKAIELLHGSLITVWECTNCNAEYEQVAAPERCVKCGRFSFEKNLYRRKTG